MISNRLLVPLFLYERTPFEKKFLKKVEAGASFQYPDLYRRQMHLDAEIKFPHQDVLFASGTTVIGQDVMFGGITTYYERSHVGGMFGALGQGLPPVEIVNTTKLALAINDIVVPSAARQCIIGPAELWTIPLGFYVQNKNGLFGKYRITTPITHMVYNGMQNVNGVASIPTADKLSVTMEEGDGYDFGFRATGLTFW
jgi:hypothetical protein